MLVAVVILAATQWVLPALVCGAIGWWVTGLLLDRKSSGPGELERVEALATWTEQLRDVLMAGAFLGKGGRLQKGQLLETPKGTLAELRLQSGAAVWASAKATELRCYPR